MDQKTRNKNNRARGGKFEKWVGDFLDMDVVPYSGSNDRFGYGDVRDTVWLGECKNITPDENGYVTIKYDWLQKNLVRAKAIKHLSYLAWMSAGSSIHKYVILDADTMSNFEYEEITHTIVFKKKSHNTKNFIMNVNNGDIGCVRSNITKIMLEGSSERWYMMTIWKFEELINKYKLKGERMKI